MKRREQIRGGARKRPGLPAVDPIFGLIEAHRKAEAAFSAAAQSDNITGQEIAQLARAADRAAWALIDNPPTSHAGVNALLAYVVESTGRRADVFPDAEGSAARKGRAFIDELPKTLLAAA